MRRGVKCRDANCKGTAHTQETLDLQLAPEHLAETLRDRQAQPCATELARRRILSLDKRLKNLDQVLAADADSGILYLQF